MTWDYPVLLTTAVSLPLIVLLHLLARRRKTLVVPSLMLWDRLLENERRSVTLRRLISDLLLLLQLLAAALLVLALAGPRPSGGTGRISGPTVLAIDVSAGMSATTDDGRTRFDLALEEASNLIRRKSAAAEVMILAGGAEVRPLTGFTSSRSELLAALKVQEAGDEPGAPDLLLRTARNLASARPGGRVFFITDGAFGDDPAGEDGRNLTEILQVGSEDEGENSGITAFAVRGFAGGIRELLVTVENFGITNRRSTLMILADDRELLNEDLLLSPGTPITRTISWRDPLAGRISARIEADDDDNLASDDEAYAVLSPGGRIRTALLTPGNWFLETLLATHPNLSLEVFYNTAALIEAGSNWDVVVADRLFPDTDPGAPLLAIYPFPEFGSPPLPLLYQGVKNGADPVSWDTNHPVLRDVDLSRVSIRSATSLVPGPGVRVLAAANTVPLVLAAEDDGRRWVALSFDLLESSLPLRPAFPILVSGALSWLVPGNPDDVAESRKTGSQWYLPSEFSGPDTQIFRPDGSSMAGTLDQVGFWTAWNGGNNIETGVSLLNADESNLAPRWEHGSENRSSTIMEIGQNPLRTPRVGPLTATLLILVLISVLLEWGFQTRRWRKV